MTVILGRPLLKPFPPFIFQHKWTTEKLLITFNILFYIALFSALKQIHCTLVTCNSKWVQIFRVHFEYPPVVYLHRCLVVTHKTAAILAHSVYTVQPCAMSRHFTQCCTHKLCVCLARTHHLHFGQNDWDLSWAAAVIWGWNRYWNKSQHGKLTLETFFIHNAPAGTWTGNLSITSLAV